jgi:hypothetical protein
MRFLMRKSVLGIVSVLVFGLVLATCVSRASAQGGAPFKRADTNQDGNVDISDGIKTLAIIFLGDAPLPCQDAMDGNDSGQIDIADAIYVFLYLFLGGREPPAPGPVSCGIDPTPDNLSCLAFRGCVGPGPGDECNCEGCCPEGFFCSKAEGDCDGAGICRQLPAACPDVFDPVCGCDGRTYSNECDAAAAGVNVAHRGACVPSGCRDSSQCPDGSYCAKADGDCGGEGACQPRPTVCTEIFDPVCGCDRNTYANVCEAAMAGVSVSHRGPCVPQGDCTSNADCPQGSYCAKADGDCDGRGVCQERPEACLAIFDPVCGCDGNTYSNVCVAAAAGVNVAHRGSCVVQGECRSNADCPEGSYCAKAEGDCEGQGVCRERPEACPEIFDPVCGCDGSTYGNACEAASAGVNVAHRGPCSVDVECGSNADCAADSFCDKAVGDCGGRGVCRARPRVCPLVFRPVCGCDGSTYGNSCEAAAAGVSVAHEGECVPGEDCTSNSDCRQGFFCAKAEGDCGGFGSCRELPTACPDVFDPVCGCDGQSYSNACDAAAAGVNVAHRDECVPAEVCQVNEDCPEGSYCAKADGNCDGRGRCQERPTACPRIFDPVCGCDGNTYGNSCEAAAAGVNVAFGGPCE